MNIKIVIEPGEDGYIVAHVPALKHAGHKARLAKKLWRTLGKQLIYTWSLSQRRFGIREVVELSV